MATPLQADSDGKAAYVVLPTTYRFVAEGHEDGRAGQHDLRHGSRCEGWKIASWTYSAAGTAAPEK